MKKKALITGITGQDGSYLAEFLLENNYEVHGIIRRSSSFNTQRINNIFDKLHLHFGDITDSLSIDQIIQKVKPDEIYHLGAQSHVKVSFDMPGYTAQTDAVGTLNMLEAMKKHCPDSKFYNATTSELFGQVEEIPQKETTPFHPRSPYGVAKLYSYWICKNYRESYNMFITNGLLFNHESERRGHTFVTKKITEGLAKYVNTGTPFYLGNLNAKRDWGYAPDFVKGMWMMLQQDKPDDYVLATGETHTIKEFIEECLLIMCNMLENVGQIYTGKMTSNGSLINKMPYEWRLDDKNREILWDTNFNRLVIGIDEKYYRPAEVDLLLGDATKAKEQLGWTPTVTFKELVKIMILNEFKQ